MNKGKISVAVAFSVAFLTLAGLPGPSLAGEIKLQKDPLFENRVTIRDNSSRVKGYIEKDSLYPDQLNVYDAEGKKIGTINRDPFFDDKWNFKSEEVK